MMNKEIDMEELNEDMKTVANDPNMFSDVPLEAEVQDDTILKVDHLKMYFPIKKNLLGKPIVNLKAVDDVSFAVKRGTTIGVVGESGCGKTTLGRTILKLYEANGGSILFEGEELTKLKKKQMRKYRTDIQLIFQDPYSSLPPRMTVGSIIAEPVRVHKIVPKKEVYNYVLDIMQKCGLPPQYYDRYPHEFSGGQRQRICIARALAVQPKLVICDEPVSALDVSIQAQIINLLKDLQNNIGLTYVFISHDLSVVKYITEQILVMYLGNVMELGETDEIFSNPLHPYTKALFSAVPVPNPDVKMNRIILEGDIPSPANPPKGCKFHTRCAQCMNVCKFKEPAYIEAAPGHHVACHLYDEEVMAHLDEYDAEFADLEEARLRMEEEAKAKKNAKQKIIAAFASCKHGLAKAGAKCKGLFTRKRGAADELAADGAGEQPADELAADEPAAVAAGRMPYDDDEPAAVKPDERAAGEQPAEKPAADAFDTVAAGKMPYDD